MQSLTHKSQGITNSCGKAAEDIPAPIDTHVSVSFWVTLNKDTRDTVDSHQIPLKLHMGKNYCFSKGQLHLHVRICKSLEERIWNQAEEKLCSAPNSVCSYSQSKHSTRCKGLFGFSSRMRYYYIHLTKHQTIAPSLEWKSQSSFVRRRKQRQLLKASEVLLLVSSGKQEASNDLPRSTTPIYGDRNLPSVPHHIGMYITVI